MFLLGDYNYTLDYYESEENSDFIDVSELGDYNYFNYE